MADMQEVVGNSLSKVQESLQTGKKKIEAAREVSTIKKELRQLQSEKALQYIKIGQQAHFLYRNKKLNDAEIQQVSEKMEAVDKKIWDLQKQIAEIEAENSSLTCANCGEKLNLEDKFCAVCGSKAEPLQKDRPSVECGKCGSFINGGSFCPACGHLLG